MFHLSRVYVFLFVRSLLRSGFFCCVCFHRIKIRILTGLEIIERIIQYVSINDKSDFNNIIDELKSLSDQPSDQKSNQPNDDQWDDFENTDSPSSCIVDVSEDESNEGEGDTLTHNK